MGWNENCSKRRRDGGRKSNVQAVAPLTVLCLSLLVSYPGRTDAFSAHLARPWDGQQQQKSEERNKSSAETASVECTAEDLAANSTSIDKNNCGGSANSHGNDCSSSSSNGGSARNRRQRMAETATAEDPADAAPLDSDALAAGASIAQNTGFDRDRTASALRSTDTDHPPPQTKTRPQQSPAVVHNDRNVIPDDTGELLKMQHDFIQFTSRTASGTHEDSTADQSPSDRGVLASEQLPFTQAASESDSESNSVCPASAPVKHPSVANTSTTLAISSSSTMSSSSGHPPSSPSGPPCLPTIRECLPDLFKMTRPINDPGVVLFHMTGIQLALANLPGGSSAARFWRVLFDPSMLVVLVALLLTSSTSMLVNDYYDTKLGNDSHKAYQPLKDHIVPMPVAKRFLSMLYAAALICTTMVPGFPARASVAMGLMLTFWYTQHLKPKTWLKNGVCAFLIAMAPFTSGMATLSSLGIARPFHWAPLSPLLRLVAMLFVGILGREITMDVPDRIEDKHHGVWTVPVVYGPKFATRVSFACSVAVSLLALAGPGRSIVASLLARTADPTVQAITMTSFRRLGLALTGSVMQLYRSQQVMRVEGRDNDIVERAVDEGLLSVVLLLASFL